MIRLRLVARHMVRVAVRVAMSTAFGVAAAACVARQVTTGPVAATPRCYELVDAQGRAVSTAVNWVRPADVEELTVMSEWCDAVGPALHAAPHPPGDPDRPIGSLAIVSWNVHVGGGDVAGLVGALLSGDLAGSPAGDVVLLLQEAYRSGAAVPDEAPAGTDVPARIEAAPPDAAREDVAATAARLGLHVYYVPSMRNGRERGPQAEDRGNAILSTLPLSALSAIELPFERQRRVAITAVVSGRDSTGASWRLRVGSTHLDARAGAKRLWIFSSGARLRQARYLADVLDDNVPTVLGSDLNTWSEGPLEPAYVALRGAFPDTGPAGTRPTSSAGFLLDYVFFRLPDTWRGDSGRLDRRFGSDHHPLLAWIRLGSPARTDQ
jgi:endonuclease/exonuclease/phosphatase family metal-dependent hydrolase